MAILRLDKEKRKCSFENASVEKSKSLTRSKIAWSKDCIYFQIKILCSLLYAVHIMPFLT